MQTISTISEKNVSLILIIIILVIITNMIANINIVVITDNLANFFYQSNDFFVARTYSVQAANCEKTTCILKSREEDRRQNRNVGVANTFFENVQTCNTCEQH
jgi:hypothetical protein